MTPTTRKKPSDRPLPERLANAIKVFADGRGTAFADPLRHVFEAEIRKALDKAYRRGQREALQEARGAPIAAARRTKGGRR